MKDRLKNTIIANCILLINGSDNKESIFNDLEKLAKSYNLQLRRNGQTPNFIESLTDFVTNGKGYVTTLNTLYNALFFYDVGNNNK